MDILMFGAGDGALRVKYMLEDDINILAYIDNDKKKVGRIFEGKSIIFPMDIENYNYEKIIIASIHYDQIEYQLIHDLNIEKSKIEKRYAYSLINGRKVILKMLADEINQRKLIGAVAELGVYRGDFAKEINLAFKEKKLYLFDTFEGFDVKDLVREEYSDAKGGEFSNTNVDIVLKKMPYRENCIIKKGYFPESLLGFEEKFSFVSIDTDLYLSVYNGLEYFYPRVVDNGYIIIHDYNSSRFKGVKQAIKEYEKLNDISLKLVPVDDLCGSVVIIK